MSVFAISGKKSMTAVVLLLAAAGGTAALATAAGTSVKGPLRCEIQVTPQKGTVTLEGVVFSDRAVDGTYSLQVEGSGRSGSNSIQQGGAFSAKAGRDTSLGVVSLGSKGTAYDVTLDVSAGGKKVSCTQYVGAI